MTSHDLVISNAEYKERIGKIRGHLKRKRLKALYLTSPTRILYTAGFSHISTERPLVLVIPQEGPIFLMGPHLEYDHVRMVSPLIEEVHPYPDYPGKTHPMRFFAKLLAKKGFSTSAIAIDATQGAAGGWGYRGPAISDLMRRARFYDGKDIVDEMRVIKSKQEIRLLKESAKWSEIAHDLLLETVTPGTSDIILGLKASQETLARMLRKLGDKYQQLKWGLSPVVVGFRGQVGAESAIPHAVFTKKKIRKGDILITEAGVEVGGYTSELERTVVVGKPSSKAQRYFGAMLKAQSAALNEFRPGIPCRRIDDVARRAIEAEGFGADLRHHAGHGIGLDAHEPPWLDPGESKTIRAGMVFSCEPGLYVPGYAGFRHSDTLEITRTGMSLITEYPRGLDELTVYNPRL